MIITSVQNSRVKAAAKLRDRSGRDHQRRMIIDGVREISRALTAGVEIIELYVLAESIEQAKLQAVLAAAKKSDVEVLEVTDQVMAKLAFGDRAEGMVAVAEPPTRAIGALSLPAEALVAVVEGAEKPGNLGAIVRTADAAGVAAVLVADGGTDLYNPNAIRASLGALFTVPVYEATSQQALTWLHQERFRLLAARVDGAEEYTNADFRGRAAIVLGSEAHGLSDVWRGNDVTPIRLPLLGSVDSLNLSVTAAVLFYEALRQRQVSR